MRDRRAVDEIRSRIDIVDLVGETVSLKKAGSTFKGLCPFHSEKTPSFTVSSERGLFKCFGCGESGDIFSFLMKTQALSFPEALKELARRAGVTLEEGSGEETGLRESILDLNARTQKFFREVLHGPDGAEARFYLSRRGIDAAMVDRFGIGLAPSGWDGLYRRAARKVAPGTIEASGLFRKRDGGGWYDLFRDRIVFPIQDTAGRILAFGAREYRGETKGPKYINSPETPVYVKGRTLYALNLAKDGIKRAGRAVLVEGYTDVILCHKHGYTQVVASLGTALTQDQVAALARLTGEIVMAYDPDAAGQAATERGIDIALNRGLTVRVAAMPDDCDPADVFLKLEPERFGQALEESEEFLEHRMARLQKTAVTPAQRAQAARGLLQSLRGITDPLHRATLIRTIAERFGVPEAALKSEAAREETAPESIVKVARGLDPELALLRFMLDDPGLRAEAAESLAPADFSKPVRGEVFAAIAEAGRRGESLSGDLGGRVSGLGLELLAHVSNADPPAGEKSRLFGDYLRSIRLARIDAEINRCTVDLQDAGLSSEDKATIAARLSSLVKEKQRTMTPRTMDEGKGGETRA